MLWLQQLLSHFKGIEQHEPIEDITHNPLHFMIIKKEKQISIEYWWKKCSYRFRLLSKEENNSSCFFSLGYSYSVPLDKWHISDMKRLTMFLLGNNDIDFEVPGTLGVIYNFNKWKVHKKGYPFLDRSIYLRRRSLIK